MHNGTMQKNWHDISIGIKIFIYQDREREKKGEKIEHEL